MKQLMFLYWIKKKNHTHVLSEGYIGITNNPSRRYRDHSKYQYKKNSKIIGAFKKYGDELEMRVLFSGSEAYCRFLEFKFRPSKNIGWNIVAGGGLPPRNKKLNLSVEQRAAIGKRIRNRIVSEETKQKMRNSRAKYIASLSPEERTKKLGVWKGKEFSEEHINKLRGRTPHNKKVA